MQTRRRWAHAAVLPVAARRDAVMVTRGGTSMKRAAAAAPHVPSKRVSAEDPPVTVHPVKQRINDYSGCHESSESSGGEKSLVVDASGKKQSLVVDVSRMAFLRDGEVLHLLSRKTVDIIEGLFPDTPRVDVFTSKGSHYPSFGHAFGTPAHIRVAESRREKDVKYWTDRGYHADSNWVVMHLDDDPTNFNFENLMVGPSHVNQLCRKPPGVDIRSGKCAKSFTIGGVIKCTKFTSTVEEAYHAYDCLKMAACPVSARDFVFKYGLMRPSEYADQYTTHEALCDRYMVLYTHTRRFERHNAPPITRVRIIIHEEWNSAVAGSIISSMVPFSPDLDVVIQYEGARGNVFQFIVERKCYTEHLEHTKRSFHLNNGKYVRCGNQLLHRIIFGLVPGESVASHVCHGPGGPLDNRKRTLRVDNASGNNRDRPKPPLAKSVHRGVSFTKTRGWRISIRINGKYVRSYEKTEEKAALIAKDIYSRIKELEKLNITAAKAEVKKISQRVRRM